ncbi:MAG: polysaccharide biosynthesis C-terminal domain-containing protein [Bacteroidales bacterium]|nr:polysaccharide biosynthesis C-terminal domain-containing protein [Bacteroidales bacterium]
MKISLDGHYGYRRLIVSSIPSIAMILVGSVYSVVDGLFVSNFVGTTAFAALNVIWPAVMLVGALGLMVGTGGSALIGKTMGEGDRERASVIFSMLVKFVIVLSVVFMVPMLLLMEPLARLLGASGEMVHQCVIYGSICTIGLPAFMLQMAFQSFYMAAEKPQLGTTMSIVCAVTNMALDALFILVFGWGLAGAAAASMVACAVGGFYPLWYFSSRRNTSSLRMIWAGRPSCTAVGGRYADSSPRRSLLGFERAPLVQACGNGLSEYVGNISFNILAICYNLQLLRMMGENGVAAYSIILYYGYMCAAVFFGYNIAVTPIIGFNYGAGDRAELRSLLRRSLTVLLVFGGVMTVLAEIFAEPAARLFVGYDPELTALSAHAFRLSMLSFVIAGVNLFFSAWFTGLNNGKVSAVLSFVRNLVLELGFVFLLPALLGPDGIWLAVDAADLVCLILGIGLVLKYRRQYGY